MERNLSKRFEDERIRRLINNVTDLEDMRKLCLEIYDTKVKQEQVMMKMLYDWKGLSPKEIEGLMPRPDWPGEKG